MRAQTEDMALRMHKLTIRTKAILGGVTTGLGLLIFALVIAITHHASVGGPLFLIIAIWAIGGGIGLYLGLRTLEAMLDDLDR